MDDADIGAAYSEVFLQVAIANHRNSAGAPDKESATHCDICGDPIPEARRLAVSGCTLCVDCQSEWEGNH